MRRIVLAFVPLVTMTLVSALPAAAIVNGQLDGNLHPEVGALIAEYRQAGEKDVLCSGTLVAPTVFLTAGHCTDFLTSIGVSDVWVTFDSKFTASSTLLHGSYVTDPQYGYSGQGGTSDPHDLAVVLLDRAAKGVTPARLPGQNLLGTTNLSNKTFTAVGYGTVRTGPTTGPNAFFFDSTRRYALQTFLSLEPSWLNLSENPSTDNGGTCYGDSGGPHFLGGTSSNLIVSITVTGDAVCRATDKTYRVDTPSARQFLSNYLTLP
ncbi:MAG TPA: trypsin-like serine protease [Candidatus Dormibacteraeota bacterium]|jgi:secreted trypsin-like serine protease|nr:trypsin-like serine protease [Candidatus Dormibacteraeota bacterium]